VKFRWMVMFTLGLFLILCSVVALSTTEYSLKIKSGKNPAIISSGSDLVVAYSREDSTLKVAVLELEAGGSADSIASVVLTDTSGFNMSLCLGEMLTLAFIDADGKIRLDFLSLTRSGEIEYVFNKVLTESSSLSPTITADDKRVFLAWVIPGDEYLSLCCLQVSKSGSAKIKLQRTLYDFSTSLSPSLAVLNDFLYLSFVDSKSNVHIIPFDIAQTGSKIDLIQLDEHPLNIKVYSKSGQNPVCPPQIVGFDDTLYLGWQDFSDEMIHIRSYQPEKGSVTVHSDEQIFREKVTHFNMFEYKGQVWISWIDDYNPGGRTTFSTYTQKAW